MPSELKSCLSLAMIATLLDFRCVRLGSIPRYLSTITSSGLSDLRPYQVSDHVQWLKDFASVDLYCVCCASAGWGSIRYGYSTILVLPIIKILGP